MQHPSCALCLGLDELGIQRVGKPRHDLILHVEKIGYSLVEAFSPQVIPGFNIDQLHIHPKAVTDPLHRTFEPIANVQFSSYLSYIAQFAAVRECGIAGNDKRTGNARQVGGQALGHTIDKIILLRIATDVHERQNHDGKPRRREGLRRCATALRRCAGSIRHHGIDPDRAADVLEVLLAEIGKLNADFAAYLIICRKRQVNASGGSNTLEPGCDIDAVSEQVVRSDDHVADIYPDAKEDPAVLRIVGGLPIYAILKLHRRPHRLHRARKFGQESIAGALDDVAGVSGNRRHDRIGKQGGQTEVRRLFVCVHEAGITGNVRRQYCR
jgi:hypothetical protein